MKVISIGNNATSLRYPLVIFFLDTFVFDVKYDGYNDKYGDIKGYIRCEDILDNTSTIIN